MTAHSGSHEEDWPKPVEILNADGRSDIVLLCEHASRHIPAAFHGLGLSDADLQRHIAWDIGAAAVARKLSLTLDAPLFLGGYSRLLIDLNRPIVSPTSIPVRSESTDIPGNLALDEPERARRVALFFDPFHEAVGACLDAREKTGRTTRLVTIHSFTPVFFGNQRPWHAGILFDKSADFAGQVIENLRRDSELNVEGNVPYVISRDEDYAVPVHGQDRGHDAILIEVRQDLISADAGVVEWSNRLHAALAAFGGGI